MVGKHTVKAHVQTEQSRIIMGVNNHQDIVVFQNPI